MLSKLNPRRSPGAVLAVIALIVALGGTAIAAGVGLNHTQKKQVRRISKKISNRVFSKRIGNASVAHATSADTAATATSATTATSAKTADTATKATDAEKLGGKPASDYQQKLQGSCPAPSAIESIGQDGAVSCTPPAVTAIVMTPGAEEDIAEDLGGGLQLLTACHDGATVKVFFQNLLTTAVTLNWFYSDGTSSFADGVLLGAYPSGERAFSFAGARIEGQFIWSLGNVVKTINLHAYDGGGYCEVRGTVETAG